MSDDLKIPEEGFSTLSAQVTRESVDVAVRAVNQLLQAGMSETEIKAMMTEEMNEQSQFTINRIYDMAIEKEIPDDFPEENVVSSEAPKLNTLLVTVSETHPDIRFGTLAHHQEKDWYVADLREKTYTLKRLD